MHDLANKDAVRFKDFSSSYFYAKADLKSLGKQAREIMDKKQCHALPSLFTDESRISFYFNSLNR